MTQHPGMFTQRRFTELGTEKENEELGYETKKRKKVEGREGEREGEREERRLHIGSSLLCMIKSKKAGLNKPKTKI